MKSNGPGGPGKVIGKIGPACVKIGCREALERLTMKPLQRNLTRDQKLRLAANLNIIANEVVDNRLFQTSASLDVLLDRAVSLTGQVIAPSPVSVAFFGLEGDRVKLTKTFLSHIMSGKGGDSPLAAITFKTNSIIYSPDISRSGLIICGPKKLLSDSAAEREASFSEVNTNEAGMKAGARLDPQLKSVLALPLYSMVGTRSFGAALMGWRTVNPLDFFVDIEIAGTLIDHLAFHIDLLKYMNGINPD